MYIYIYTYIYTYISDGCKFGEIIDDCDWRFEYIL